MFGGAIETEGVDAADLEEFNKLALALLEIQKNEDRQIWQNLFPDEGPLRRELYPKHMEFFENGAKYRERLFMAANRCLTPWSYLETPAGLVPFAELMTLAYPRVLSWDGESRCVRPMRDGMLLGLEPAFRLVLDNGSFFDCNRRHRVLSSEGWLSLDQLMSRADGLRCWHTVQDYQANCDEDGHLGDRPLLSLSGIGLELPPSQADAQTRAPLIFSPLDAAEHRFRYNRACRESDHLSTLDDLRRLAALFAPFSGASSAQPVLSLSGYSLDAVQLAAELAPLSQEAAESRLGQFAASHRAGAVTACGAAYTLAPYGELARAAQRSHERTSLHSIGGLSLHDGRRTAMFFPFGHPSLVGGRKIVACVPLGFQPIVDAHVPDTNNYFASGVVHHNTGKTVGAAFEISCHLTGRYPAWWTGRRFRKPISAWVAGDTNETTRDIIQKQLLGGVSWDGNARAFDGVGIIPYDCHGAPKFKVNTGDLLDHILVKHETGGWSELAFKSYEQGRKVFQGTAKHVIWLDEECPMGVYNECLIRTATTDGIVMLTFTPLLGMSEVVRSFLSPDMGDLSHA